MKQLLVFSLLLVFAVSSVYAGGLGKVVNSTAEPVVKLLVTPFSLVVSAVESVYIGVKNIPKNKLNVGKTIGQVEAQALGRIADHAYAIFKPGIQPYDEVPLGEMQPLAEENGFTNVVGWTTLSVGAAVWAHKNASWLNSEAKAIQLGAAAGVVQGTVIAVAEEEQWFGALPSEEDVKVAQAPIPPELAN